MKIVIAPDSFKGSASAKQVAEALARGWRKVFPNAELVTVPMADGGEGTMEALVDATGGKMQEVEVSDPLGRPLSACYGILGDGKTAVVEVAAASGLPLLAPSERKPLQTTTYGTGQLIRAALKEGVERLLIGLGGSATVDGGAGLVSALGARLLDADGQPIGPGGGSLGSLAQIQLGELPKLIEGVEVLAACDVDNPLTGPNGAAAVFGPQKGAAPQDVQVLDQNLAHYAQIISKELQVEVANLPGAGAAGGLGAGLVAFLGAKLIPGIQMVIEASKLEDKLEGCDLVITGEGKLDGQSAGGKTPVGVAKLAEKQHSCFGRRRLHCRRCRRTVSAWIGAMLSIAPGPISLEKAIADGEKLLEEAGQRAAKLFALAGWRD